MVEQAVRAESTVPQAASEDEERPSSGGTIDGAGLTPATKLRPPGLLELEELLAEHLDTRVNVQLGAKRGKITIDFADLEDLERIYRQMTS
jgi:ParB family chromosome partitioning protein